MPRDSFSRPFGRRFKIALVGTWVIGALMAARNPHPPLIGITMALGVTGILAALEWAHLIQIWKAEDVAGFWTRLRVRMLVWGTGNGFRLGLRSITWSPPITVLRQEGHDRTWWETDGPVRWEDATIEPIVSELHSPSALESETRVITQVITRPSFAVRVQASHPMFYGPFGALRWYSGWMQEAVEVEIYGRKPRWGPLRIALRAPAYAYPGPSHTLADEETETSSEAQGQ